MGGMGQMGSVVRWFGGAVGDRGMRGEQFPVPLPAIGLGLWAENYNGNLRR
jgi:hypothetical protein